MVVSYDQTNKKLISLEDVLTHGFLSRTVNDLFQSTKCEMIYPSDFEISGIDLVCMLETVHN